jgi:hypothetical protein
VDLRLPIVARRRDGRWKLRLNRDERAALSELADRLGRRVADEPDHQDLRRLFPPAYPDDVASEAEWQVFRSAELRSSRQAQLEVVRNLTQRESLTDAELLGWMQAVNSLRLVLGTQLGLETDEDSEALEVEPDDPRLPDFLLFDALGYLIESTVRAMSAAEGLA